MGQRILLVEGEDDQHVVWNLFKVRDVPERFQVDRPRLEQALDVAEEDRAGGIDALLDSIPTRLLQAELECLAVIVDADAKGPVARWQAIRARLENAGYEGMPGEHSENGLVFNLSLRPGTPRSVRFAVWIMPDNRSHGMIEDFVAGLIRHDDAMLPLVDQFLASIPAGQRRFAPAHLSKARIHSWLAVSKRPGRPMGQAIQADKYVNAQHPSVQPFLDWIQTALVE